MKKKNYSGILIKFLFQGILIIDSPSATVWIIWSIFKNVDNLIPNISRQYPGTVFAAVLFDTALIGFVGSKLALGRLFVSLMDYIAAHIPGVKVIYSSIKSMLVSFAGDKYKSTNPVWMRVSETPKI